MWVRITAGSFGIGHVIDLPPAVARARITARTAVLANPSGRETAMLEQPERGRSLEKAPSPEVDQPAKLRKRKSFAKLLRRRKD